MDGIGVRKTGVQAQCARHAGLARDGDGATRTTQADFPAFRGDQRTGTAQLGATLNDCAGGGTGGAAGTTGEGAVIKGASPQQAGEALTSGRRQQSRERKQPVVVNTAAASISTFMRKANTSLLLPNRGVPSHSVTPRVRSDG